MPPKASKRKAANGYKLPDHIPEGTIISGIGKNPKQFRLGKSIGTGGFGEIYLVSEDISRPVKDDATLAMKIEPHENGPLFVEMNFYIRSAQPAPVEEFKKAKNLKSFGMPCLRGNGSHVLKSSGEKYRFLVMDRFGKDLQKIFQTGKKLFTDKVTYNLALKVIDCLEYIHFKGYCHNDIKAQNMLLGYGRTKENDVYLVDFGLVSKYQKEGVHHEYKPDARKAHDGTIEYTSRDAHIGAHSRRSDFEILAYNLVHWMSGELPWMDKLDDCTVVQKQKIGYMNDIKAFLNRCFQSEDYPAVLEEFLNYVVSLEFDTPPDYDMCRQMFKTALTKAKYPLDGKIDFTSPKKAPKKVRKSSPLKRKADLFSDEDAENGDDSDMDDSLVQDKPVKKRKSPVKKVAVKKTVAKKAVMKDQGCQTSPGFVKAVKAARRKKGEPEPNVEMDEFVEKAVSTAKKAVKKSPAAKRSPKKSLAAKTSPKKSPAKKAKDQNGNGAAAALSNPTPAMLALMAKKAESNGAKKPRTKK